MRLQTATVILRKGEPMSRLIDADALIRKFKTASPMAIDGRARQMVEDMPTIEPERKKGTWEPVEEIPSIRKRFKRYCCSGCKKAGFDTWNFCPECGQRNREGEQE